MHPDDCRKAFDFSIIGPQSATSANGEDLVRIEGVVSTGEARGIARSLDQLLPSGDSRPKIPAVLLSKALRLRPLEANPSAPRCL